MATLPFLDLSDLRSPSAPAQDRVAARVDEALRGYGAFHAVGHGIPIRIPQGGFAQARLLFGLPASTKASLRAEGDGRGFIGSGAAGTGVGPSLRRGEDVLTERFTLGADLPSAHPLVAAGTVGYGPNRWPPLHAFRDALTAWQRAALDVTELLFGAIALAHGLPADHLVAHHRCPLQQLCLDRYEAPSASDTPVGTAWEAPPGGLELSMVDHRITHELRSREGVAVATAVEPGAVLIAAGAVVEELTAGRYRAPRQRWVLHDTAALRMSLTNDLDHDTPLDCLRRRTVADPVPGAEGTAPPAARTVGAFLAGDPPVDSLAS